MLRRGWAVAGVLAVTAAGLALVLWPASHPELDPDRAERVTLYSIDFREEGERLPGTGEVVHGYPVLGKVEVTGVEQRRQLFDALKAAIAQRDVMQYKCFYPRHVLRVEQDGWMIDYVVCFQCRNYERYVDGNRRDYQTRSISEDAAPVFNKPLEGAGIPIVPKMQ
jgi:hypothetical protein